MNTTAVHMHAGIGMQPHPLYSVGGAVLGTALVCAGLLWAFTHTLPVSTPTHLMQWRLLILPAAPPNNLEPPVRHLHVPTHSAVIRPLAPKPVVIPETSAVQPMAPPAVLDLSLPGLTFAPPAASAFVPHAANPYSDLSRALNAPLPPPTMHNGDAYGSIYGSPMVKSGGRCLVLENIQTGPSPSAHTTVGFGVPCPGDYRPSMADNLKAWADKQAAKSPAGP